MASHSSDRRSGPGNGNKDGKKSNEKSEEEQIVTCPGCMTLLTDPRTLSCIHVFCAKCTGDLKRVNVGKEGNAGVQCPICLSLTRERDIQPSTLMAALLDEYHKLQLPREGKRRLCDQCETHDSFWKCHECKIYLCENCVEGHQRIPYCKGHKSLQAGLETLLVVDKVVFCDKHPDMRIEYNCADCEVPMCELCKTNEHEDHVTESVQEALERLCPIHEQHCENLDGEISLLQRDVEALDKRAGATDNPTSKQELTRIRDHILDLMTKSHTLRWWLALAMNRSKNEFLLRELQGHVKQRLEENGREPPRVQRPKIPPQYDELRVSDGLPHEHQSPKRPDDKKPKRAHRTQIRTRCSIASFLDLLNHKENLWLVERHVQISGDGCTRIGYINDTMWLPVRDMDHIKVLDPHSGELISVIELPENTRPWVVQQINHNTIIMAAETGLYSVNSDGSINDKLHDGTFNDINADGNYRFVCLEYTINRALVFQCTGNDKVWKQEKSVKLRTKANQHLFSSVMMLHDSVVASGNTVNAFSGAIHTYKPLGQKRRAHKTSKVDLRRPILCGIDSHGSILLADTWRDKILVMSPEDTISAVKLHNQVNIKGPTDVLFVNDDVMWLLVEEAMGTTTMVKYTRKRIAKESESTDELADDISPTGSDVLEDSGSAGEI